MAVSRFEVYQIRAVDAARLVRKLGRLHAETGAKVLSVLGEMFAP